MSTSAPVAKRPTTETTKKPKRRSSFNEGTGRLAALLLSPTMIVLILVVGLPILAALRESLYQIGVRLFV